MCDVASSKKSINFLSIKNCPTETKFFIKQEKLNNINKELNNDKFKIVIGAGSSGITTRWGSRTYTQLINKLNELEKKNRKNSGKYINKTNIISG